MKWKLICHILKKFGITRALRGQFNSASRLLLYERGAEDIPGVVYVTRGGGEGARFRFALTVSAGPYSGETDNLIELEPSSLADVFNALAEVKNYLDTLDGVLAHLDAEQELLDAAGMYLNCPLFYFDESYRVLAITRYVVFDYDEEWRHMLNNGFLSPENALKMKESGELDMLAAAEEPVVYKSDIYPFTSIVLNVRHAGRFAGRLNMLCTNGDASPRASAACEIIAAHLIDCLTSAGERPAGDPLLGALADLLRGVELSEALINERLRTRPKWYGGTFRLFCVDAGVHADKQVGPYYSSLLEGLCTGEDVALLTFNERLVLLAHGEAGESFERLSAKLAGFVSAQRLRGGVSNGFERLSLLRGYYAQALWAMENGSGLSRYREHMLERIFSYVPEKEVKFLISPDIFRLLEADASRGTALTGTLREYVSSGCNLTRTAESLFIHKNTLLYRLARIKSIISADLADPDERLLLMLSFKLLENATILS